MAKEIKAIKCPNCGSVSKTEIKPDFFKCNSCQTEYFLDDNDVNINYNHNYNNQSPFKFGNDKTIKIVIGCILGFILFIFLLTSLFSSNKPSNNNAYSSSTPIKDKEDIDNGFSASRFRMLPFLQNGKPLVLALESRRYNSNENKAKEGTYITIYDPIKKDLLNEEKISEESHFTDITFRTLSDGNIYMINDKATFLKFNKQTFKIEDIGKKLIEANNELAIGVATMEFVRESYGNGLIILTNDGKKLYYYPFIQKLYTEKELYKVNGGFNNLLPTAKDETVHQFTGESYDYPQEKVQLIAIKYRDNGVGPKDMKTSLSWGKDYGRSGIFNGTEPHTKELINPYQKQTGRVLSWKDVTPNRLYFKPSVILDKSNELIIQFQANANEKSAYKFQKINPQDGSVLWTSSLKDGSSLETLIKYKDGFFGISRNDNWITIDEKGNITSEYKLD